MAERRKTSREPIFELNAGNCRIWAKVVPLSILSRIGRNFVEWGKCDEARDASLRILEAHQQSAGTYCWLAVCDERFDEVPAGLEYPTKATALDPASSQHRALLGSVLARSGQCQEAAESCQQAAELAATGSKVVEQCWIGVQNCQLESR